MKLLGAFTVAVFLLPAQTELQSKNSVTAIRHWSMPEVTRVAIEVSGEFTFVTDHLHNPERVYFDIPDSRPHFGARRNFAETVDDKRLKRIRVAETLPGVTRVVLDLGPEVDATASQLTNPSRLIIELRIGAGGTMDAPPVVTPAPVATRAPTLPTSTAKPEHRVFIPPVDARPPRTEARVPDAPRVESPRMPAWGNRLAILVPESPARPRVTAPPPQPVVETAVLVEDASKTVASAAAEEASAPLGIGRAARHTTSGDTSLVRALGLKVGRVVIDPGHGGHDQGTQGKTLLEKDLVLDVAKRVGRLVEEHMGAEVVYTRSDDTFIPLERRTAIANEKKADLFLSIHANSSPVARISGVETYYLNFADSKDALDVASRENATSQKSVFELRDIIQKITLHDKAEESKEFAGRIQTSLYNLSVKNFPNSKNRGVKKAPFVVLIGANMPSILAEIGFLSNPHEEALLKRPEYRQKIAEALFHGLSRYAESLSHFQQVAQAKD